VNILTFASWSVAVTLRTTVPRFVVSEMVLL